MKHLFLCLLFGLGLTLGHPACLSAAPVSETDTTENETIGPDTTTLLSEPSAAELRTDSLLNRLDSRLSGLEQHVGQIRSVPSRTPYISSGAMVAILIILLSCSTLCFLVFIVSKCRYRICKERYERDRFAIERGCYPKDDRTDEPPLTRFIRKLFKVAVGSFIILVWIGLMWMSNMSFFSVLFWWILTGGTGYAVVYLFRQYVQRREENR